MINTILPYCRGAKAYLSISAEDMREISFYNANLNAYEVSMWVVQDTSTLKITGPHL